MAVTSPAGVSQRISVRRRGRRIEALLDEPLRQRDDAVTAHRAVALVVHEQHGDVGIVAIRRQQHGPVHVAVAARLVHQHPADVVGMLADPGPALVDGQLRHRRDSRCG